MTTATETLVLASNQTGALADSGKPVLGGRYAVVAKGTLGTGPALEVKGPDGSWYAYGTALAAGWATVDIPAGLVRAHLASDASGAYVYISRIPS